MDIRKFFKSKASGSKASEITDGNGINNASTSGNCGLPELATEAARKKSNTSESESHTAENLGLIETISSTKDVSHNEEDDIFYHKLDLGNFINPKLPLPDNIRIDVIKNPFKPSINYNFKGDSKEGKRAFRYEWFQQFEWLTYSSKLKGALCKYCVIFRPVVNRGVQGASIVKPFIKYNDFMASAKAHSSSDWHKQSTIKAQNFIKSIERSVLPVIEQICNAERQLIESNRKKLFPIISTIIFCGTHDLALRSATKGNFEDLLDFRVESGDVLLTEHLTTSNKNAKYTSHQTQNELISICGEILRKYIVEEVNFSDGFSIIADESVDIAGIEQISIGVRFVDNTNCIREEFLGFSELSSLNAEGIAKTISNYCLDNGLNMEKSVGLGFDGCATMAGHENGVQKKKG
ncbi:zinc finger MYM-type protein 1-like [Anthonomus grandis grandis]|uniref:zinc finger MYM-type protein 1-like n=1 Tax=Anthonomus grandis grandis TaxID=2921223 RepID=UPI00216580CC|nr:zinc finger MYM-type protein 1-like [Anthonomus grandis grandis]